MMENLSIDRVVGRGGSAHLVTVGVDSLTIGVQTWPHTLRAVFDVSFRVLVRPV